MNEDQRSRSEARSSEPEEGGRGRVRRRYQWNSVHFYPDIIHQMDNEVGAKSLTHPAPPLPHPLPLTRQTHFVESETPETVTSYNDRHDDVSTDDEYHDSTSPSISSSTSGDEECFRGTRCSDVITQNNVGEEKIACDVTKRVKWLDQQEQEVPSKSVLHRKEELGQRRHPVRRETSVDSDVSSSTEDIESLEIGHSDEFFDSIDQSNDAAGIDYSNSNDYRHYSHPLFIDETEADHQRRESKGEQNDRRVSPTSATATRSRETHFNDPWPEPEVGRTISMKKATPGDGHSNSAMPRSILRNGQARHVTVSRDNPSRDDRSRDDRSRDDRSRDDQSRDDRSRDDRLRDETVVDAENCGNGNICSESDQTGSRVNDCTDWFPCSTQQDHSEVSKAGNQHSIPTDYEAKSQITDERTRRRFVFHYRHSSGEGQNEKEEVEGSRSVENALTLEDFEQCLEIQEGNSDEIPEISNPKPETNISCLKRPNGDVKTSTKKEEQEQGEDDDAEVLWLFNNTQRSATTPKDNTSKSSESVDSADHQCPSSQSAFKSALNFHEDRKHSFEHSQLQKIRQQYRWSTCLREPEARLLIDETEAGSKPDAAALCLSSREEMHPTLRYPAMFKMERFPLYGQLLGEKELREAVERTFTVVGQPRSRKPLQVNYDKVESEGTTSGAQRKLNTIHEGGFYSNGSPVVKALPSTLDPVERFREDSSPYNARKHKYLRERIVCDTADSAAQKPEAGYIVRTHSLPLSRRMVEYQSLQNLEDMLAAQEQQDRSYQQYYQETSSIQSLPHGILYSDVPSRTFFRPFDNISNVEDRQRSNRQHWNSLEPISTQKMDSRHYHWNSSLEGRTHPSEVVDPEDVRSRYQVPSVIRSRTPRTIKARNEMKAFLKGKTTNQLKSIKSSQV